MLDLRVVFEADQHDLRQLPVLVVGVFHRAEPVARHGRQPQHRRGVAVHIGCLVALRRLDLRVQARTRLIGILHLLASCVGRFGQQRAVVPALRIRVDMHRAAADTGVIDLTARVIVIACLYAFGGRDRF